MKPYFVKENAEKCEIHSVMVAMTKFEEERDIFINNLSYEFRQEKLTEIIEKIRKEKKMFATQI